MNNPVTQLTLEIAELENVVLYFQNRIARKLIAREELLHSADVSRDGAAGAMPGDASTHPREPRRRSNGLPTVPGMITERFREATEPFWYDQIKSDLATHYGADSRAVGRNVYVAMSVLLKRGVFVRAPGGFLPAPPRAADRNQPVPIGTNGYERNGIA